MATKKRSHHKIRLNTKNIRRAAEQIAVRQEKKYQNAGIKAMKELRTRAVTDWYMSFGTGTNAYEAMNNATEYESSDLIWENKKRPYISIYSGVNLKTYQEYMLLYHRAYDNANGFSKNGLSSLENWKRNHIKDITIKKTYSQYMFDLKWEEGIYGLPERATATGSGWVNPNFLKSKSNLDSYVTRMIYGNWRTTVNKYLQKKK